MDLVQNPTDICNSGADASRPAQGHNSAAPQINDLNNPVQDPSEAELEDEWVGSSAKRNSSPCRQDDSHGGNKIKYPFLDLPDDIWRLIHFLLPMKDAARAACVSRSFLSSWRCYPYLTFTNETMCSKEKLCMSTVGLNVIEDYHNNIHRVLTNHSGTGVTKLKIEFHAPHVAKNYNRLRSWLEVAVTPGIEELDLALWKKQTSFKFPCKLLSDRCRDSIRYLCLCNCILRPKFDLGLRNLKTLDLCEVRIKEDKLGCLLSSCVALENLKLLFCDDIIRLEIPCLLQRLSFVEVSHCSNLRVMEKKAPNISRFHFSGFREQLSLGESLKVKDMNLSKSWAISYAINNLPSCVPNLETLAINSLYEEMANVPMVSRKFLHLKYLSIVILGWNFHREYDFLSLVSFFDASPCLETFDLTVEGEFEYDSFEGDSSSLRRMPGHCHGNLKHVKITNFCCQKSMIELTCYVVENATSLESLTVDASHLNRRCSGNTIDRKCPPLETTYLTQARKAIFAVKTYIEAKVPPNVKLSVLDHCSVCHAL